MHLDTRANKNKGSAGKKKGSSGKKKGSAGKKQSNNLNQDQDITVKQDSGDVILGIDDSNVSLGSINTGNTADVSASQSAAQKNS